MIRRRPRITIGVSRRSDTPELDRHRNPVYTYSEFEPVQVFVVAPSTRSEPTEQGRSNAVLTAWDIYAPLDTTVGPYDRVRLPDGTITEVIGEVGRWADNPHALGVGRHKGVQFTVERRQG